MTGWNPSTASGWSSDGRAGACPKARKLATHMATALLGLTTTALMSGGLHYDNILQETPHLVGGTKIAAAAIGWSATSSVIMPAIEATARWPGKKTTGALAATGISAALGTALTAVAANVEASDHRDDCDRLDSDQLNQEGCAQPLSEDITAALHVLTGLLIAQAGALIIATLVAAVVGLGRCNPAED